MSKVVARGTKVFHGNEVDYDITCCEYVQEIQQKYRRLWELHREIDSLFHPSHFGSVQVVIVGGLVGDMEWAFCPICGDRLKKDAK